MARKALESQRLQRGCLRTIVEGRASTRDLLSGFLLLVSIHLHIKSLLVGFRAFKAGLFSSVGSEFLLAGESFFFLQRFFFSLSFSYSASSLSASFTMVSAAEFVIITGVALQPSLSVRSVRFEPDLILSFAPFQPNTHIFSTHA